MDRYATLRSGLVGAWCPSLRYGGLTLEDRSQKRNNGAITGATWLATPGGMSLNIAANQFVDCGSMGGDAFGYPFAASCWVRNLTNGAAGDCSPFAKITSADTYKGWMMWVLANKVRAYWNTDVRALSVANVTGDTQWKHLLIQWTGANAEIWINGVLDVRTATTVAPSASAANVNIGRYTADPVDRSMGGQIDDCRIYNRSLTQSEIVLLASQRGIGLLSTRHRRAATIGSQFWLRDAGTWKKATGWIKVNGVWTKATPKIRVSGAYK